ncbi:MAG: YdeI/OmpD-associated family protein [Gemmatimonadaceae bacterium]
MKPTFFKTTNALRAWFTRHGATKTELWIGYYKKASGKGGVVYQQALDEALCVGWIDGIVKSIDDTRYMQRWTPRKPTSIWSKVNIRKVQALTAAGRMTPAGLAAFARRTPERSGIYSFENDPPEFSPEFATRFRKARRAWAFFESQPPGYRRTVTAYVMSAKQIATRERRLAHVITHAMRNERIPQYGPTPRRNTATVRKK